VKIPFNSGEKHRIPGHHTYARRKDAARDDTLGGGGGGGNHQEHQQQPKELSEFWVGAERSWAELAGWLN